MVRLPRHGAAVRQGGAVRRPRRAPGAVEHRRLALPGDGRDRAVRDRQRPGVLELLHLLRDALLRRRLRVDVPLRLRAHDRAPAARGGLPAPRGARGHRRAHRGRGARAVLGRRGQHQRHRLRVARAAAPQRADLAGHPGRPGRHRARPSRRRGHHRRPRVPRARGGRARRPVPPARRRGPHRAVDDGDPRPPRRVRPRAVGPALRAQAARLRGLRLRAQALLRPRRVAAHHDAHQPAAAGLRARDQAHLARPGHLPLDAARHRRRAVRVLQVPHDVPRRRRPPAGPGGAQRGLAARCSRSATTRA